MSSREMSQRSAMTPPPKLADLLVPVPLHPSGRTAEGILVAELRTHRHGGGDGDLRHLLDATGDNDILHARHDGLGGKVNSLLGGAALAVDRRARHMLGQPRREPARAGDVAGLAADRVEAAEHHVLDGARVDATSIDQCRQGMCPEVSRMDARQGSAALADWSADRFDDVSLWHGTR